MNWQPELIPIEPTFDNFVRTFRGGVRFDSLDFKIPSGFLSADYLFAQDNTIAELKCLEKDPRDAEVFARRVIKAYQQLGIGGSELLGCVFRGDPINPEAAKRILSSEMRTIREAIKKANKQIRSNKRLLNRQDARGLVLVANDNNYGLTPQSALSVLCRSFKELESEDCHIDGMVYFTPNVFYDDGTPVAKSLWMPVYNVGSETFSEFVNCLGKAWFDYFDDIGIPAVERKSNPEPDPMLMRASPILAFRRPK